MTAQGWSIRELGEGRWWACDSISGMAIQLDAAEGERLWRQDADRRARSLSEARATVVPSVTTFVDLDFLGVRMRYVCPTEAMVSEIARQYDSIVPALRRSPDIEAKLGEDVDFDRLHRSVETQRLGVLLREVGDSVWRAASRELPVIPIMQARAFTRRFVGLHSALLHTRQGGILVCGEQKAGKTSTGLVAQKLRLGEVLADEMTLIDRDAVAYGAPLPVRERTQQGRIVRALTHTSAASATGGLRVAEIVILQPSGGAPEWLQVTADAEALRLLAPNLRVLDTSLGEAADRLLALLQNSRLWLWRIRAWPQLTDDIQYGLIHALKLDE